MAEQPVSVALVDASPLVRAGLTTMAQRYPGRVVFLEEQEANRHPDRIAVFVYDATINPVENADALAELMVGRAVVVALGARSADPVRQTLTRVDVIPLSVTSKELVEALELAARPQTHSAAAARERVRAEIMLMTGLSQRQVLILDCIASGWSNPEIASANGIGVHTVKRETQRILTGIGVDNRVDVVLWAVKHGLVATGSGSRARVSAAVPVTAPTSRAS